MTQYDPKRPVNPETDPRRDPLRDPAMDAQTISETEARQGGKGRPVLYVLIGGLVLALVAWALAEMYPRGGSTTADAPATIEQATPDPQTTGSTPGAGSADVQQPAGPSDIGGIPIAPDSASEGVRTAPTTGNTPPAFDSAR